MREHLRQRLRELGATDDEIDRAEVEHWLPLLAIDRALSSGTPIYDLGAVAAATGLDEEYLHVLWRALGFPDVPDGAVVYTDDDVRAARRLLDRAAEDALERDEVVRQVQTVSAAMARVASVEADAIVRALQRLRAAGVAAEVVAEQLLDSRRWEDLAALIEYEHRLQLRAAIWRQLALEAEPDLVVAVGFADLAGYTKATEHLASDEIAELVARWESCAYDTVAEHGARVIKTIGDEVMFVGLPDQVVFAALALIDAACADPAMLEVRAAVAAGPVVLRAGDVFGPVVNLASRLSEIAPPGAVLAPASLQRDLPDVSLRWLPVGVRTLRSIGEVEVCALQLPG